MKAYRLLLLAAAFAAPALPASAQLASAIQAVVHDAVITTEDVESLAEPALKAAQFELRNNPAAFKTRRDQLLAESLELLVQRQLVLHDFTTATYSVPESVWDEAALDRAREDFGDRKKMTQSLQAKGSSFDEYRQEVRDQMIVDIMRNKHISSGIIISPRKIEKYYKENAKDFERESRVKLRMITLNKTGETDDQSRARAEEILSRLKEGANFAEMASLYSQGAQRTQGGDWGWATRLTLRKELADVAFTLKKGDVSPVIETATALFIMFVEDINPAQLRPLSDVRDEIENILLVEERKRLSEQYIAKLKKKTLVQYY